MWIFSVQYKNIFGDDFQWNQVSCQHLYRSGGGGASPPMSAPTRRFLVSSRSRRFRVSRLWILQRNGLLKFLQFKHFFVVFAGKKQPKHVEKMPETWKNSSQKHGRLQKLFQIASSIFCLSSPCCWRYNANARSQNALPFLHHNEIAPCYAGA